jgi:hypothetical protein
MPRVCAARRTAEGNPLARYLTVVVLILANPDELIHRDVMKNLGPAADRPADLNCLNGGGVAEAYYRSTLNLWTEAKSGH